METIIINGENENIIAYLEGNTLTSYRFLPDNTVENIGEEIYKYFEFLIPKKDKIIKLPNEGSYEVVLNLETNYKHYYLNGIQDISMFYFMNGKMAIAFDDSGQDEVTDYFEGLKTFECDTENGTKRITISHFALAMLASALVGTLACVYANLNPYQINSIGSDISDLATTISPVIPSVAVGVFLGKIGAKCFMLNRARIHLKISSITFQTVEKITPEMVKQWFLDAGLSDLEIGVLYNEPFLRQKLPIINSSQLLRTNFMALNQKITIKRFGKVSPFYYDTDGYVRPFSPSIHIKDGLRDDDYYNTLSHEGTVGHKSQFCDKYPLIYEARAEINSEDFNGRSNRSYLAAKRSLKILMEVIGIYPIEYCLLTGDDSLIKRSIEPYLNKRERKEFFNCLKFKPHGYDDGTEGVYQRLDELSALIYRRVHGTSLNNNPVIAYINKYGESPNFHRSYFNLDTRENSYYEPDDGSNTIFFAPPPLTIIPGLDMSLYLSGMKQSPEVAETENIVPNTTNQEFAKLRTPKDYISSNSDNDRLDIDSSEAFEVYMTKYKDAKLLRYQMLKRLANILADTIIEFDKQQGTNYFSRDNDKKRLILLITEYLFNSPEIRKATIVKLSLEDLLLRIFDQILSADRILDEMNSEYRVYQEKPGDRKQYLEMRKKLNASSLSLSLYQLWYKIPALRVLLDNYKQEASCAINSTSEETKNQHCGKANSILNTLFLLIPEVSAAIDQKDGPTKIRNIKAANANDGRLNNSFLPFSRYKKSSKFIASLGTSTDLLNTRSDEPIYRLNEESIRKIANYLAELVSKSLKQTKGSNFKKDILFAIFYEQIRHLVEKNRIDSERYPLTNITAYELFSNAMNEAYRFPQIKQDAFIDLDNAEQINHTIKLFQIIESSPELLNIHMNGISPDGLSNENGAFTAGNYDGETLLQSFPRINISFQNDENIVIQYKVENYEYNLFSAFPGIKFKKPPTILTESSARELEGHIHN